MKACLIINNIRKRYNSVCDFILKAAIPGKNGETGLGTVSLFDKWDDGRLYRAMSIVHYGDRNYIAKRDVCGVPPNYMVEGTMTDPFWQDLYLFAAKQKIVGEE